MKESNHIHTPTVSKSLDREAAAFSTHSHVFSASRILRCQVTPFHWTIPPLRPYNLMQVVSSSSRSWSSSRDRHFILQYSEEELRKFLRSIPCVLPSHFRHRAVREVGRQRVSEVICGADFDADKSGTESQSMKSSSIRCTRYLPPLSARVRCYPPDSSI